MPEGPAGLAAAYSPAQGTFKPAPKMPRKHRPLDARAAVKMAQSLPSPPGAPPPPLPPVPQPPDLLLMLSLQTVQSECKSAQGHPDDEHSGWSAMNVMD